MDALAHLGAAVVEVDRAVAIDLEQAAGLVHRRLREADAVFDRHQPDAALDEFRRTVPGDDRGAALAVAARRLELVDDPRDDVVVDGLVIGRLAPVRIGVEIRPPHVERVLAEGVGDLLDPAFGGDDALRAAIAAERRVRHGVGPERLGHEPDVGVVVGVVGVHQRAVGDAARQVLGVAAAGGEDRVDGEDAAVAVVADIVVDDEVVALAGDDHVVVAVGTELDRAPEFSRRETGDGGEQRRLGLLAAEAAAHPPAMDPDRMGRQAEDPRRHLLHVGRVLRRRVDRDLAVLAGDGQRHLSLEIEVLLPADRERAGQAKRRGGKAPRDIAARRA